MKQAVVERIEVRPEHLYYHEHIARYRFAARYIQPGLTLDLASGSGYGSNFLAQRPGVQVVGVDVHQPTLLAARRTYPAERIDFVAANGEGLPFRTASFQNIVTLETIEHIRDDVAFVEELRRVLRPSGVCTLSTPNRDYSVRHRITNPYHVREYTEPELAQLLGQRFSSVEFYYQGYAPKYHQRVVNYSHSIQAKKQDLAAVTRLAIDHLYRPLKRIVPTRLTNHFVRNLLRLSYPQPNPDDIQISADPAEDTSVLIAVCH